MLQTELSKPAHNTRPATAQGKSHREAIDAVVEQVTRKLRAVLPRYQEPEVGKKRMKSG